MLRGIALIVLVVLLLEWFIGFASGQANTGEPRRTPQFHGFTPPGLGDKTASASLASYSGGPAKGLPGFEARPAPSPATPAAKVGSLASQPAAAPRVPLESTAGSGAVKQRQENEFPAVVRLVAFDDNGQSFGSGSYIGNSGRYGLVLSNWHVICDAEGLVHVHFANGFSSYGYVVRVDKKWDLALIAISSPPQSVSPLPIAKTVPKPGDPLWIAGYGSGSYRMVGGQCVRYLAPDIPRDGSTPEYEIIELSATARQGDSGGPILNNRGELAGVLFGSDMIRNTAGSFCRRVDLFLREAVPLMQNLPEQPETHFAAIEQGGPRVQLNLTANSALRQTAPTKPERPMGDIAGSSSFGVRSGSRRYFSNAPGSTNVFDRMMGSPAAESATPARQAPPSVVTPQSQRSPNDRSPNDPFVATRSRSGERNRSAQGNAAYRPIYPSGREAPIRQVGHQGAGEHGGIAFASFPDPFDNGMAALNPTGQSNHVVPDALASSLTPMGVHAIREPQPVAPTAKYGASRHFHSRDLPTTAPRQAAFASGHDPYATITLVLFLLCSAVLVLLAVKLLRGEERNREVEE